MQHHRRLLHYKNKMLSRPSYKDYLNQTLQIPQGAISYPKSTPSDSRPPLPNSHKRTTLPQTLDTSHSFIAHAIASNMKDRLFLRETYGSYGTNSMHSAKKKGGSRSAKDLSVNKSNISPSRRNKPKEELSFYEQQSSSNYLDPKKDLQPLKKISSKNSFTETKNRPDSQAGSYSRTNIYAPLEYTKSNGDFKDSSSTKLQITATDLSRQQKKYSNYLDPKNLLTGKEDRPLSKTPKKRKASENFTQNNLNNIYTPIQFRSKHSYFGEEKKQQSQTNEKDRNKQTFKLSESKGSLSSSGQKISINDFTIGKKLGEGRFGHVFMTIHKQTGAIFALKRVPKAIIRQSLMKDQFALQVRLQASIYHPNIVSLYAVFDDKDYVYLLTEYLAGGSLYNQLKKKGKFQESEAAAKVHSLCRAVQALHLRGIAHRDIKPQNIMMCEKQCKLGDFGWATICDQRRTTYCGTTDYVSPEIVGGQQYGQGVDMWCVGVFAFELLSGRPPFYHLSRQQTFKRIQEATPTYPSYFSAEAVDFIGKLLRKIPQERMCAVDALLHPFLSKAQDK